MPVTEVPPTCTVVIIGAGIAGCMSALSLAGAAGVKNIVMLEAGEDPGVGVATAMPVADKQFLSTIDQGDGLVNFINATRSGTAVLDDPVGSIKMIINLYPCSSKDFIKHHGKEGAEAYLKLAKKGIDIESNVAKLVFEGEYQKNFRQLGSHYVTDSEGVAGLWEEYNLLKKLNAPGIEWMDEDAVASEHGAAAGFVAGIKFPHDAIVNSSALCKKIVKHLQVPANGFNFQYFGNVRVTSIKETYGVPVEVNFTHQGGTGAITCDNVVVATGGLFAEPNLFGILSPRWSYLVGVDTKLPPSGVSAKPLRNAEGNSPNYFTWGYTHDWCTVNGHVRISGEDHFSALKPPRMKERCESLAKWVGEKYPELKPNTLPGTKEPLVLPKYMQQYGVYSETPDHLPILGSIKGSRICYIVGCNAWGQASLSYCASLVPKILNGINLLSGEEQTYLKLLSIRRFQLLPIVQASTSNAEKVGVFEKVSA